MTKSGASQSAEKTLHQIKHLLEGISSNGIGVPAVDLVTAEAITVTAGGYTANDAVGGEISFVARRIRGLIEAAVLIDDAAQDVAMELWIFDRPLATPVADNAVYNADEADLENLIGVIDLSSYRDGGTGGDAAVARGLGIPFEIQTGNTLIAQLVTRGTPTFAATDDITLKLHLIEE